MRLFSIFIPLLEVNTVHSLQFYDKTVSFYDEGKAIEARDDLSKPSEENKFQNSGSEIRSLDKKKFDWKNYENPKSVQFWDAGGDFVPSLPWRYLASYPTEENIKNYVEWQNKKIKISFDLQKKLATNSPYKNTNLSQSAPAQSDVIVKSEQQEIKKINWNQFEILYFYQTHCPYCQMSNETIFYLKQMGAKIIPIQIDWDTNKPEHKESLKYDEKLDAKFHITSTPTWILKVNNTSKRINGYAAIELLSSQASDLLNAN